MISCKFRLSWASSLLLKPLPLIKSFDTFCSCQWLYFSTVDSFLSISGTGTWAIVYFMANLKEFNVISSSKIYLSKSVKIFYWIFGIKHSESHALSLVHNFAPDCEYSRIYYILAPSVSNFSSVTALFLSVLPVRLIMWGVLLDVWVSIVSIFSICYELSLWD